MNSTNVAPADSATQVYFTERGNPQGVPLVLIHAFPLNHAMWADQYKVLEKDFRVIALDLRGLGKSGSISTPYTMEFLVDDLLELLDGLKIDKAVVCGLSMGGYVALRAIERNPERFLGLILADTQSTADSNEAKVKRYQALKTINTKGLPVFANGFLLAALSKKSQTAQPELISRLQRMIEGTRTESVSHALMALVSRTDTSAALPLIKVPTLILVGEDDAVTPVAAARAMHEQIEGSQLYVVPDAGHLSNMENPEDFNAALVGFLGRFQSLKAGTDQSRS